jgi:hypothetical protein
MKRALLLLLPAALLSSCETVPIAVSYTGVASGYQFTAGYSRATGTMLTVHQK